MVTGEHHEALEEWWNQFQPIQSEVETVLDGWQEELVRGNAEKVQQEIRTFAKNREDNFHLIALAFDGVDKFYADMEATAGEEAVKELQKLAEKYDQSIEELFWVIRKEEIDELKNPITSTKSDIEIRLGEMAPLIQLELSSGPVPILELHETPDHFLDLANSFGRIVEETLIAIEESGEELTKEQAEKLERQVLRLQERGDSITEILERLETKDLDENTELNNPSDTENNGS